MAAPAALWQVAAAASFVRIVHRRWLSPTATGNVASVAATTLADRPAASRVVAAALGTVVAIFTALVVLIVALAAAAFAVRWALTLGAG